MYNSEWIFYWTFSDFGARVIHLFFVCIDSNRNLSMPSCRVAADVAMDVNDADVVEKHIFHITNRLNESECEKNCSLGNRILVHNKCIEKKWSISSFFFPCTVCIFVTRSLVSQHRSVLSAFILVSYWRQSSEMRIEFISHIIRFFFSISFLVFMCPLLSTLSNAHTMAVKLKHKYFFRYCVACACVRQARRHIHNDTNRKQKILMYV